ncbi:MAG: hypothetical protein Q8N17_20695 [Burkholderiaceae bacterium]|nr:hypothetical protein [Burkholderiaceae bacterium]
MTLFQPNPGRATWRVFLEWGLLYPLATLPVSAQVTHGVLRVSMTVTASCQAGASAQPGASAMSAADFVRCGGGQAYRSAVIRGATMGVAQSVDDVLSQPAPQQAAGMSGSVLTLAIWY